MAVDRDPPAGPSELERAPLDSSATLRERRRIELNAERKAELHRRPSMQHLLAAQCLLVVRRMCRQGELLELGCGNGDFLDHLSRQEPERGMLGIDVSAASLELARERLSNAKGQNIVLLQGDATRLPECLGALSSPPRVGDVVMRGLVHHLPDPESVLRGTLELLEEGGRLTVLEGNANSGYRRLVLGFADLLGLRHEASEFSHTPPDDVERQLAEMGYVNIHVEPVPGLLAPLSYLGIGGKLFWRWADEVSRLASRMAPAYFGWWYLLTADKPGPR